MSAFLGDVTSGCRERLISHYGIQVEGWLSRVPTIIASAAHEWGLKLWDYHDAGHASALVTAESADGTWIMLKAWYDRKRYLNETIALRHWQPINGHILLSHDNENAVASLKMVGGEPGGEPRPTGSDEHVAAKLEKLHCHPVPPMKLPSLETYLRTVVASRIQRRIRQFGDDFPSYYLEVGLSASPVRTQKASTLLHTDLYKENVPFEDREPIFLDPLPMLGDPAFDWAFFIVYHDFDTDPLMRLTLASQISGIESRVLVPWCIQLCLDGLLYYHEVSDEREFRMADVMTALVNEVSTRCP